MIVETAREVDRSHVVQHVHFLLSTDATHRHIVDGSVMLVEFRRILESHINFISFSIDDLSIERKNVPVVNYRMQAS